MALLWVEQGYPRYTTIHASQVHDPKGLHIDDAAIDELVISILNDDGIRLILELSVSPSQSRRGKDRYRIRMSQRLWCCISRHVVELNWTGFPRCSRFRCPRYESIVVGLNWRHADRLSGLSHRHGVLFGRDCEIAGCLRPATEITCPLYWYCL